VSGRYTIHSFCVAVLPSAQVLRWHKTFKDGRESVEDERNVARVKAVLDRDRRLSVQLTAEEVGLLKTDVHRIITEDLHMRKICAQLVPSPRQCAKSHIIRCERIFGST